MKEIKKEEYNNDFLSSPKIIENKDLLADIGVIDHINSLNREIIHYKSFLANGLDIFNSTTINEIMNATVYQISDQFMPSFIAFMLKPVQTREDITIKAYRNYKPAEINLHFDNITPFEVFFKQHQKPINIHSLALQLNNDEAVRPYMDINTEIIVPIIGPLGLYGIILLGEKLPDAEYSREELMFLEQLMCFVSQAIKNHLHYEYSLHDVKTGLYNHGFFLARLAEETARIKRSGSKSSVIVMDVDKFKNFNDSYGHLAGDVVLETLAKVVKQSVRTDDIPSRFGGEEFTVLLPGLDDNNVMIVAERLRINISEMKVPWETVLPQVTVSLGIFTFDKNTDGDVSGIIRCADEALYVSKRNGRNRCTIWKPGIIDAQEEVT